MGLIIIKEAGTSPEDLIHVVRVIEKIYPQFVMGHVLINKHENKLFYRKAYYENKMYSDANGLPLVKTGDFSIISTAYYAGTGPELKSMSQYPPYRIDVSYGKMEIMSAGNYIYMIPAYPMLSNGFWSDEDPQKFFYENGEGAPATNLIYGNFGISSEQMNGFKDVRHMAIIGVENRRVWVKDQSEMFAYRGILFSSKAIRDAVESYDKNMASAFPEKSLLPERPQESMNVEKYHKFSVQGSAMANVRKALATASQEFFATEKSDRNTPLRNRKKWYLKETSVPVGVPLKLCTLKGETRTVMYVHFLQRYTIHVKKPLYDARRE